MELLVGVIYYIGAILIFILSVYRIYKFDKLEEEIKSLKKELSECIYYNREQEKEELLDKRKILSIRQSKETKILLVLIMILIIMMLVGFVIFQ